MNAPIKNLVTAAAVAGSVFAAGFSYAGSASADLAALEQAVRVCQQKVQRLEAICPHPGLQGAHNQAARAGQKAGADRFPAYEVYDSVASYGSPYWGFQGDN